VKELIRIRTEINEIEASRTLETSWRFFLKQINQIDQYLPNLV
jgi:hypothetical protein